MSNELTAPQVTDLTESETKKVRNYIESGLPGIGDINETRLYRMLDLYMTGSTYSQIANILEVKKVVVLYLAHINNWYVAKQEYLNEIQEKIKTRVIDSKLRNQEFTLLLTQALQKKISKQLTKFLSTNDPEHMEGVDLKEVALLMKAMETVNSLDETPASGGNKPSPVGINVGYGVDIEKTGDNRISITPKADTSIGSALKVIADKQREEQRAKDAFVIKQKSDIENETKGVKNEDE